MTTSGAQQLLDKREERIQRMFGQIAPWYDRLNHLLSLNIDKLWRRWTTQLAPPPKDAPLLDLCTGTGDLALAYDRASGGTVPITGADFCAPMLDIARQKAARANIQHRVQFHEADTQQLPFPTDHYGLVTCAFGLRNVTDTDRGLIEMLRVARPGGRVAILEFSRPTNRLLGGMYLFYFRRILPKLGQMLSRSPENAYKYLPESVLSFPDGEAMLDRMRGLGYENLRRYPFTFGVATLYLGEKPNPQGINLGAVGPQG
ncbi:MAG: bifunctional demethylmenaquinone methyltransferase/2-methoxy-6-polyprenyl-1,4-benzoquinol methylase UbiE [Gemmataceae bacterium]